MLHAATAQLSVRPTVSGPGRYEALRRLQQTSEGPPPVSFVIYTDGKSKEFLDAIPKTIMTDEVIKKSWVNPAGNGYPAGYITRVTIPDDQAYEFAAHMSKVLQERAEMGIDTPNMSKAGFRSENIITPDGRNVSHILVPETEGKISQHKIMQARMVLDVMEKLNTQSVHHQILEGSIKPGSSDPDARQVTRTSFTPHYNEGAITFNFDPRVMDPEKVQKKIQELTGRRGHQLDGQIIIDPQHVAAAYEHFKANEERMRRETGVIAKAKEAAARMRNANRPKPA